MSCFFDEIFRRTEKQKLCWQYKNKSAPKLPANVNCARVNFQRHHAITDRSHTFIALFYTSHLIFVLFIHQFNEWQNVNKTFQLKMKQNKKKKKKTNWKFSVQLIIKCVYYYYFAYCFRFFVYNVCEVCLHKRRHTHTAYHMTRLDYPRLWQANQLSFYSFIEMWHTLHILIVSLTFSSDQACIALTDQYIYCKFHSIEPVSLSDYNWHIRYAKFFSRFLFFFHICTISYV